MYVYLMNCQWMTVYKYMKNNSKLVLSHGILNEGSEQLQLKWYPISEG